MIKNFFLIIIFLLISSCDYSPLYSSKKSKFFNIEITEYRGDNKINSILRNRLNKHKNMNFEPIKIEIETEYTKKDLSRKTSGDIETYELILSSRFFTNINDENKIISISRKSKMENFTDKFEERDYENRMKENMANSIYEAFILQLN